MLLGYFSIFSSIEINQERITVMLSSLTVLMFTQKQSYISGKEPKVNNQHLLPHLEITDSGKLSVPTENFNCSSTFLIGILNRKNCYEKPV